MKVFRVIDVQTSKHKLYSFHAKMITTGEKYVDYSQK